MWLVIYIAAVILLSDLSMNSVPRGCDRLLPWFFDFLVKSTSFVLNLSLVWQFEGFKKHLRG